MNFRNAVSDTVPSVEAICTNVLKMNPFPYDLGKPSNRTMAYSLFFYAECLTPDSSEEEILAQSIFTDDFIRRLSHIDLTHDTQYENPLLYYIIHRTEPFPTSSKYSQFLSNLFQKNYSGKNQPKQIRMLLNSIDFKKLSFRIDNLIQNRSTAHSSETDIPEITEILDHYLKDLTLAEPALTYIFAECKADSISTELALVLLYSLFNESSFHDYMTANLLCDTTLTPEYPTSEPEASINIGSDRDITLSKKYRRLHTGYHVVTITLICLTALQMVLLIMPFANAYTWESYHPESVAFLLFMLLISLALFSLRKIPFSLAKKSAEYRLQLLPEEDFLLNDATSRYHRFQANSQHFKTYDLKRKICIFSEGLLWLIFIGLGLIFHSLPLFIAGAALSLVIYLECDHLLNRQYAVHYDKQHPLHANDPAKKGTVASGEGKIYSWDYDVAADSFHHHGFTQLPNCSADCIRYIFYARIDRYQYQWTIAGIVLTTLTAFTIIIGILQFMLPISDFIRIPNQNWFLFFCLILLITTGIYYIILLSRTEERFRNQTRLAYYCSDAPLSDQFLKAAFLSLYERGIIKNIDIGHGVYSYDCVMFENGKQITDLREDDRMIVIHRYYDAVRRISLDFLFFTIAYVCFFVWHLGITSALWGLPGIAIIYFVFAFYLFPRWDEALMKHKIRKYTL